MRCFLLSRHNFESHLAFSVKDSNDNASSSRQHAVSLDNRLGRVEDTLRKLLPMAQAFEAWSQSNPDSAPSAAPFTVPDMAFSRVISSPDPLPPIQRLPYKPSTTMRDMLRQSTSSNTKPDSGSTPATPLEEPDESQSEKWTDRFSHLAKDSCGNLRFVITLYEIT